MPYLRTLRDAFRSRRAQRALERQLAYQRIKARHIDDTIVAEADLAAYATWVRQRVERHAKLQRGTRVLEVGSGAHGIVFFLGVPDAVGVDPLADEYRKLFPEWQSRAKTIAAYGEELPFPDGSFDVVFSDNVVDHAERPARIARELVRVLAPGGLLYFTVNVHHPIYGIASRVHGAAQALRVPFEIGAFADHTVHLTVREARALFADLDVLVLSEETGIAAARDDAKREEPRHAADRVKRVFFKNARFELIARRSK